MQSRIEENFKRFDEMMSCRNVHDCFAKQAQMARDNCEAFLGTAQRTSLSTKLADDVVKQLRYLRYDFGRPLFGVATI